MIEQAIILGFLIIAVGATLWLYLLKARKEIEYRKDERWQLIQNKAGSAANITNYVLILLIAAGATIPLFVDTQITFTLNRVVFFGELFIGVRNSIELAALKYYDKQL